MGGYADGVGDIKNIYNAHIFCMMCTWYVLTSVVRIMLHAPSSVDELSVVIVVTNFWYNNYAKIHRYTLFHSAPHVFHYITKISISKTCEKYNK